ncbi:hypothetical protein BC941DRAFT_451671 [Chlamydoabsidia padenii]|nr:hypothetical protein BC941DRAFT_451671 [Chlamydoabsidia padenii]
MDPNVLDSVMEQLDNSDQNDSDDDTSSTTSSIPEVDSNVLPSDTEDQQDVAKNDPPSLDKPLAGKFRDHYMGQMTVAFGSELDTIRQEPGFTPSRLNVLIDSLEAGMAIFSDLEKTIALANDT